MSCFMHTWTHWIVCIRLYTTYQQQQLCTIRGYVWINLNKQIKITYSSVNRNILHNYRCFSFQLLPLTDFMKFYHINIYHKIYNCILQLNTSDTHSNTSLPFHMILLLLLWDDDNCGIFTFICFYRIVCCITLQSWCKCVLVWANI